jgi:3-methyl-2-oxobutanoate hydroxymethyltransferase
MTKKMTITSIKKSKGVTPLVVITAYDALFAKLMESSSDMILVGDSLNMSFAGKSDTLSATLEQMIYHTNAVAMGAKNSFLICDMPFGTYVSKEEALKNAIKVFQESPADAIKIEGGADKADIIKFLCSNGIAVCGHIGLLPQAVRSEGGYKVKGKTETERLGLIEDAKAGKDVDGQVLVFSDMLGLFEEFTPKFVKKYMDGASLVKSAIKSYSDEVKSKEFPQEIHTY